MKSTVNKKDSDLLEKALEHKEEALYEYRLLWTFHIGQYQFNEKTSVGFELFKLLCFSKYSMDHYKSYFTEYLNKFKFKTIGTFISSFHQVAKATMYYNKDEVFSKLSYISPIENVDEDHLQSLSINNVIGQGTISLPHIKKYPLFFNSTNGYMVIDQDIYIKKLYKGPFFDLQKTTSLEKVINFNAYSSDISKNVMEGACFKYILKSLVCNKHDFIHFDDNSDSIPDNYYRRNKTIFLTEFKAYLFPDDIPENPNFEAIKKYIDERFVENQHGKAKGIIQLKNQIELIREKKFEFDEKYNKELHSKHITVYPIICFDEFHFTMPGVNEYLTNLFVQNIKSMIEANFTIKNLTLINLNLLFDFMIRKGDFKKLEALIDRYWKIIHDRTTKYLKEPTTENFLKTKTSFDEIYYTILSEELGDVQPNNNMIKELSAMIGITQKELDEEL